MQNLSHIIGHTIISLDSVDSTNNYIAKLVDKDNLTHGTAVVAWDQTQGRGRFKRKWEVVGGLNLTFSYLLYPSQITPNNHQLLSKMAAVAICEWLKTIGLLPKIKLPNDVLIKHRKIAGILIENKWQGKIMTRQIAGIGINVNQELFEALYKMEPTSVRIESGIELNLEKGLQDLFSLLSHYYILLDKNPSDLDDAFHQYLIRDYIMDEEDRIKISEVLNDGSVTYLDDNGFDHKKMMDDLKLKLLQ